MNYVGWFTEGIDAPDVKEAKALLDELFAGVVRPHPIVFQFAARIGPSSP